MKYSTKNVISDRIRRCLYTFFQTRAISCYKKVERLMKKPIINYCFVKITSIIDRLFAVVEKKYNVWNNVKLVLLLETLLSEFDLQKVYILGNQNITLKKTTTSWVTNKVQIFRDYSIGLKKETIAMTAKMK